MPTPSRNDIYEAVIRKMVTQALEEQETIFEQNHGQDTDEGLILYLWGCAQDLGYSPRYKEVIGWRLLEQRFGGWNAALQQAELAPGVRCPVTKIPRIIEETEKQKEIYRQRKAEKKTEKQATVTGTGAKKERKRKSIGLCPLLHGSIVE